MEILVPPALALVTSFRRLAARPWPDRCVEGPAGQYRAGFVPLWAAWLSRKVAIGVGSGLRLEWLITEDLASLRECVRAFGTATRLTDERLADLVVAASEAATHVLQYGGEGGGSTLIAWCDAEGVSLEVVDAVGVLTTRHLNAAPDPITWRGVGLWLMRRLCDQISLDDGDGTTRLHLRMQYRGRHGDRGPADATGTDLSGAPCGKVLP
ncbi:ATP-binding protein [Nonomuraea sp. MTCD27]|uniref:ATP-binding protein n=1 Tax=Nonomuraea sp. MTCD27 TaxID=1676747 RepID=UPI0035C25767